jgi:hypothetical protein
MAVAGLHLETDGVFERLDPVARYEVREEFISFLRREQQRFRNLDLHATLRQLNTVMGSKALVRCCVDLFTTKGQLSVCGEGFGVDAAVRNVLQSLQYSLEHQRRTKRLYGMLG